MKVFEDKKAGYCPICNSELEYGDNEIDGEHVYFYFTCPSCGATGSEEYYMEFERIVINEDN